MKKRQQVGEMIAYLESLKRSQRKKKAKEGLPRVEMSFCVKLLKHTQGTPGEKLALLLKLKQAGKLDKENPKELHTVEELLRVLAGPEKGGG